MEATKKPTPIAIIATSSIAITSTRVSQALETLHSALLTSVRAALMQIKAHLPEPR
jgi:hypothetical protein